jgi:RND family efflux transporter MFP subunit
MKRFVTILVGLLIGALGCSRPASEPEKTPPAPVKWMEARQMFIEEWTEIIGTTQPLPGRSARVSAAVEGRVISIVGDTGEAPPTGSAVPSGAKVGEGQLVKKGDILVRLDDRIARANRDKAQADLADLEQQVQQAGLAIDLAELEVRRLEELSKKGTAGSSPLIAPVELDKARLALDDAKSKRKGTELRVEAGRKQLHAMDEQLELYTLTAPISGRLGRLLVVQGQTLSVGAPVAEILDIDEQIDLLCFVPPYIARKLKEGQTMRIEASEAQSPGQTNSDPKDSPPTKGSPKPGADGKIIYIADQTEVDTGNFAVKARMPNAGRGLRSNMTVRALVLTTPGKACLTLPESALLEDQEPPAVIVVDDYRQEKSKDDKDVELGSARKLNARVGIRDRVLGLVEISGVDDPQKKWAGSLDTAKFVFKKGQGLRTGDPIKLEEEEEEEPPPGEKKEP